MSAAEPPTNTNLEFRDGKWRTQPRSAIQRPEPTTRRSVARLRIHDMFEWCGRSVELVDWETDRPDHRNDYRPCRRLVVRVPDHGLRPLYYYDDEIVEVSR